MAATAKRVASKAAAYAAVMGSSDNDAQAICTDASGARIRAVGIHLTPLVPGLESHSVDSARRWKRLWGASPAYAVRASLKRIAASPRAVEIGEEPDGSVALVAQRADGVRGPLIVFWEGLTADEVRAEVQALATAGWEPR